MNPESIPHSPGPPDESSPEASKDDDSKGRRNIKLSPDRPFATSAKEYLNNLADEIDPSGNGIERFVDQESGQSIANNLNEFFIKVEVTALDEEEDEGEEESIESNGLRKVRAWAERSAKAILEKTAKPIENTSERLANLFTDPSI
ncbi:hypothetical protein GF357_02360, partial [Candidatus Dojkabacteria bacterium]|nr:hypothetical protein [Candidatus Dojkabacteria bacterium]